MFKNGPIPPLVHGLLDYVLGGLLIAVPFLFSFDISAAKAVGIVGGVVVLVIAATTAWTAGLIKSIPTTVHAIFDIIIALLLIASPFLFSFSNDGTPTAVFIVAGVFDLLWAIGTRFTPEPRRVRGGRDAAPTA